MYDMYLIDSLGGYALMTNVRFGTVFIRRYATVMFLFPRSVDKRPRLKSLARYAVEELNNVPGFTL